MELRLAECELNTPKEVHRPDYMNEGVGKNNVYRSCSVRSNPWIAYLGRYDTMPGTKAIRPVEKPGVRNAAGTRW